MVVADRLLLQLFMGSCVGGIVSTTINDVLSWGYFRILLLGQWRCKFAARLFRYCVLRFDIMIRIIPPSSALQCNEHVAMEMVGS